MASEKYSNDAHSTLNGGITDVATSFAVVSASLFPTTGQFRIIVEDEKMLVTSVLGDVFIATRGIEGTTAAAHAHGKSVTHILTKGALDQIIADNCQYDTLANQPAAEKAGRIYIASDSLILYRDSGSGWVAIPLASIALNRKHMFLGL